MKRLIIIGAGAWGREVAGWARASLPHGRDWELAGFLDSRTDALQGFDLDLPVLGSPDAYQPGPNDVFVCAIGTPAAKKQVVSQLVDLGARFVNVIHPTVIIGRNVRLGTGIILCPRVILSCDIEVGDHVGINMHSVVSHDARIGPYSQLSNLCDVTGGVTLGEGVFMGSKSTVLPQVSIGAWANIGAASAVVRDLPEHQTVMGVPARPVPARF